MRAVEGLALPHEQTDSLGDLEREGGARRDDRRARRLPVGDRSALGSAEQLVELLLRQLEQGRDVDRHGRGLWKIAELAELTGENPVAIFRKTAALVNWLPDFFVHSLSERASISASVTRIGKDHVRRFLGDEVDSTGDEEPRYARKHRCIDHAKTGRGMDAKRA